VGGASELEALGQLPWRITRTTQALQQLDLKGSHGGPDPLGRSILLTWGAGPGALWRLTSLAASSSAAIAPRTQRAAAWVSCGPRPASRIPSRKVDALHGLT
jgi:hypothetical protein